MGWCYLYPAKDANGDPIPITDPIILAMNAEADNLTLGDRPNEEYSGEADSRGLDSRGFNKGRRG